MNFKLAIIKATAILLPTYAVAFATEKMVYTMPMLAAVTIFVTALDFDSTFKKKRRGPRDERRIDDDGGFDGTEGS